MQSVMEKLSMQITLQLVMAGGMRRDVHTIWQVINMAPVMFKGMVQYCVQVFQSFQQKDFSDPTHPNSFQQADKTCPLRNTMNRLISLQITDSAYRLTMLSMVHHILITVKL